MKMEKESLSNNIIENSSDYNIHPNTEEQILESVKTYLKLYENPKQLNLNKNKILHLFKKYNPLISHTDYNCIILD